MILPVHDGCVLIMHLLLFLLSTGLLHTTVDKPSLEIGHHFEFMGELVLSGCLEFSFFKSTHFGFKLLLSCCLIFGVVL